MSKARAKPKKYDIREVARLHARSQSDAEIEKHRAELAQSLRVARRIMWTVALASGFLCYYLFDNVSQVLSLL